jgi:hypothetical protein
LYKIKPTESEGILEKSSIKLNTSLSGAEDLFARSFPPLEFAPAG